MSKTRVAASVSLVAAGVLAAVSAGAQHKGDAMEIRYGRVDRVDEVKYDNKGAPKGTGTGAIVGGLAGSMNASHGHEVRDAAAGALAGALLTAAYQQHKHRHDGGYQYTVSLLGGGDVAVVVEHGDIAVGDCVAVERGGSANVRRVSDVHCDSYGHGGLKGPGIAAHAQEDAAECHVAKESALRARNDEEIDVALKKVRVFCES